MHQAILNDARSCRWSHIPDVALDVSSWRLESRAHRHWPAPSVCEDVNTVDKLLRVELVSRPARWRDSTLLGCGAGSRS
jgi:hypothetical protein